MNANSVTLLTRVAEALDGLVCYVGRVNVNFPEMAWLALVLRELPDDARIFPHGKWATIQSIEAQLAECAREEAQTVLDRLALIR